MKGKIKYILIVLVLLIIAMPIYLYINFKKYEPNILTSLSSSNISLTSPKEVQIQVFPLPSINIYDIKADYKDNDQFIKVTSPKIKLNFSLWNLLQGKFVFNKALFDKNTIIETNINMDKKKILSLTLVDKNIIPIQELNFKNVKLIFNNKDYNIEELNSLNISFETSKFLVNAVISEGELGNNINFNFTQSKENLISAVINSSNFNLSINGQLDNNAKINAKMKLDILNGSKFFKNNLALNSHFDSLFNLLHKANITTDLELTLNELNIENFNIISPVVKASAAGKLNIEEEKLLKLNLKFNSFNIDDYSNPELTKMLPEEEFESFKDKNYNNSNSLFHDYKILLSLVADNATIKNEKLNNININFEASEGKANITSANFTLNDDAKIQFSGNDLSNKFRPAFEGKISLVGNKLKPIFALLNLPELESDFNNFDIKANLFVSSKELRLYDLNSKFDEGEIIGKASVYYSGLKPSYDVNFKVKNFNIPEKALSNVKSNLVNLLYDDSLTRISKLQWLRKIDYQIVADLNFNDLNLGDNKYKYLGFEFILNSGIVGLTYIKADSDIGKFRSNLSLNVRNIEPSIKLDVIADKINYDSIIKSFNIPANGNITQAQDQQTYKFPTISDLNGDFNFDIRNLYLAKNEYQNIKSAINISDNKFNINNFEMDLSEGKLKTQAIFQVSSSILSATFALKNILIEKLFENIGVKGYFSSSGHFITAGNNISDLISKLQGDVSIAGRNIAIENIDIEKLISAANSEEAYESKKFQNLTADFKTGETKFSNLDGALKVTNGILQTNSLLLDNSKVRGAIAGSINLKEKIANIIFKFAFIPQPKAPQLNFEMKFIGDINKPNIDLDAHELENYLKKGANNS